MPKTPKADTTEPKAKQPTPCERANKALARANTAQALTADLLKDAGETVLKLTDEIVAHVSATRLAAGVACDESIPYARRLTASGRAKQSADSAEQAASELKVAGEQAQIDADAARLEVLENSPGYTKNTEWLEIQERIAARRF